MELNIFDFLVDLEKNIARLYSRLRAYKQFSGSRELLDFMDAHSQGHADSIGSLRDQFKKPVLETSFFLQVHRNIEASLLDEVKQATSPTEVMDALAKTEELVGKMYGLLSNHYKKLASYYSGIAESIEKISHEEFAHRDMVLAEKKRYV